MPDLVALALQGGPVFVEALRRVWDAGDAVLPLDPHAPRSHLDRLIAALAPGAVIETDGERRALGSGVPVDADDAVVIASSGTTGEPKGAVHTHAGVAAAARITAAACDATGDDVRWLACLPLAHVGGFSVVTRALLAGTGLEVHDRAEASRIDDAARRGATHVSLVPTLLRRIDPDPWRLILLGGSAIPADRPPQAVATYGMTETFGGVVYDGLPLEGVEVRIAAADATSPSEGAPVTGAIELRTPTMLRAYRRTGTGPGAATSDAPGHPVDGDGWYRTGDLGSIDADGILSVAGRADDLIISGGVNVWPGPVEDVLRSEPGVADVAVVGVDDPEWGQRVRAVVVPADPGRPPSLDELRDAVKEHLPPAAAPRELLLADVLPRTALGKIERHRLTDAGPTGHDQGTGKAGPTDAHR